MKRIAIVGPGAIGGTLAAWLAQKSEHEVVVCARTAFERIELETPDGPLSATPRVLTDPASATAVDWVLVATKTYDAAAAAKWFPGLCEKTTRVAVLQNGVEHVARFSSWIPPEHIVPVMIDCPAERLGPGRVRQRGPAVMLVPENTAGAAFVELFAGLRIDARTATDWITAAWRKLALNAAGGVSAVTLQPAGVVEVAEIADVMRGLVREVIAVGRAEGAKLEDELVDGVIGAYRRAPRDAVNSLHADRAAGRPMESDARNGVVVRLGRKHGIPTPYNESVFAYLRAAENANGAAS